ncbi:MAG: hypothetical protein Q9165_004426 [Trypethelium subeluteriae]
MFLESFDQHAQSLSLELKLDHASTVLEEFELLQEKVGRMEELMKTLRSDVSYVEQTRQHQEEEEAASISIRRLIRWIRPPGWQQSFDDANRRFSGTCGWFFDEPCYKVWEGQDSTNSDNPGTLLVQGKPGYGKTYLCASLIEHLKYSPQIGREVSSRAMGFDSAFYFYDKRQPQNCQSIYGFRAVLAQLLQARKCDRETLDLACFAMGESVYPAAEADLEELKATNDEILNLIQIILQRSEGVTLVFDGVDECSDTQDFFYLLAKATNCTPSSRDGSLDQSCSRVNWQSTETTNTKVVLFSRPDLHVPRVLFERAFRIQLASRHNVADIKAFIHSSLQDLVDDALLGCHIDLRSVTGSVSSRADGMFLWARLLIEYLRCDTFTPQDRMEALFSLNNFEGLDRLYGAILQKLHQRLPANGRLTVQKAFAWVAGAFRPLLIDEFEIAIVVVPGRNTSGGNAISNIEQALIRMSGALLELAADRTVRFVHPSVKSLDLKKLENITAKLWLLSTDMQQLKRDWHSVLSETPNEIWNPSISNHALSDFWPKASGATWKSLRSAAHEQEKAMLIESHVFEDSMELGLVKILIPRHILELSQQDLRCTFGWRASYEVWSLSTSRIRFLISLEIDPAKVQTLISTGHIGHIEDEVPQLRELEFQFPVVFGESFRNVLILDYLVYVEEMPESQSSPDPKKNCRFSIVDLTNCSPGVSSQERECLPTDKLSLESSSTCSKVIPARKGAMSVVRSDPPAVQKSNDLVITRNEDGLQQASLLQQSSNSVVLQTVVEDGSAHQSLLSKVPWELGLDQPVLLKGESHGHNGDDVIRIAWIRPPQAWYSFDEILGEESPVLCERTQATIRTTSTKIQLRIHGYHSDTKRKIASADEQSDLKKRRIEGSCENSNYDMS